MILVTTGTQLPFDRLIVAVDEIAPSLDEPVFAQIGEAGYRPRNIEWTANLHPVQFDEKVRASSLLVSHAGIGTILRARKHGKPIILFPRQLLHGEHRNDHQLATCAQLAGQQGIYIATDVPDLHGLIARTDLQPASAGSSGGSRELLIERLRRQIAEL